MKKLLVVFLVCLSLVGIAYGLNTLNLQLVWDDFTFGGGARTSEARSVSINKNRVIVGELLSRPEGGIAATVKGFNLMTGAEAWTDTLALAADATNIWVGANGTHAFAVAAINLPGPTPGVDDNVIVRGYDQKTGNVLWTNPLRLDSPTAVLFRNGKIVIVGYGPTDQPIPLKGQLVVLDAATGVTLWTNPLDLAPLDVVFFDVDRAGSDLVVVGSRSTAGGANRAMLLRDYRIQNGHLRWEIIEAHVAASSLQIANDVVYVAGIENYPPPVSPSSFVAAYRLGNGTRLWKANPQPGILGFVRATDSRVFASGPNFIMVSDALTGNLVWSKALVGEPDHRVFVVRRILPIGDRLLAIGRLTPFEPFVFDDQLAIRLYDAGGNLETEDLRERTSFAQYNDVAAEGNRFVAVGAVSGLGALVRAYELQLSSGVPAE